MNKLKTIVLIFIVFSFGLVGCEDSEVESKYERGYYWASLPSSPDKNVDVFYAYPTVYMDSIPPNMDIADETNRQDVLDKMNEQMGLYAQSANIFTPYYQQMYRDGFNDLPPEDAQKLLDVAYNDVAEAFRYYMKHLNDGRPFILVGHSQGAGILIDLLRKEFDNPEYADHMVAAYTTGVSVMPDDLITYPWIKIAQNATDTGVVITYNTLQYGYSNSSSFQNGTVCVNPLLWTTNGTYASNSTNLGAVWTDSHGVIYDEKANFTDAQICYEGNCLDACSGKCYGALVVTTPDPADYYDADRQPYGAYHDYDQIFFYKNLQVNVDARIAAFFNN